MLKAGLALRASQKDLEEVISMHPDPSTEEQQSLMQRCGSSSSTDASDSQDDCDQHPLEVVDDNNLTRDQGAEAERQESVHPSSNNGKDRFISTLNMLKELIENLKWSFPRYEVFEFMVNILEELKQDYENPSTAVDKDWIPEEKVKFLATHWDKLSPNDEMFARTILFVVLSQIQRAIMTNWGPEENLKPLAHVREIVQKLLVFVRTTRSDHESILHMQRDVANVMWRFNHLDKCSKRFYYLLIELVELNIVLLSSLIEQMVVLWPSLEYYAQGRGSNPVLLSGGNSDFGIQTLTNICKSPRCAMWKLRDLEWLHLALSEMLSEQQEWADIISRRLRSRNGGDSIDMGTEYIGSILEEALKTTSCLLGPETDPRNIYQDDGDEKCSMFRIEYLGEEKLTDTNDLKSICDINDLVYINRLLLHLRWSLDKFIEDYVRASKREEVSAEHDQDICAWYFVYEDRNVFEEEDAKAFGTSLTELDDIPYADGAKGVTECNAAMEIFLNKFLRQIRSTNDNSLLQHGDAGIMLQKLGDRALWMEQERMKSLADIKRENLPALKSRLIAAYGADSPGACSWRRRLLMPTDALLFRIEREALTKIVSSPESNVLENMDRVAVPNEEYVMWNLEDDVLEDAITSFSKSKIPKPRAQRKDVVLLMLFPVLYLLDIATDCNVAYQHCSRANYLYFALTLLFIFGPVLAEIITNFFRKLRGYITTWTGVFSRIDSWKLLPRALRSVMFAINSRRKFDHDLHVFYEELNRARGGHYKELAEKLSWSKISLINVHSFAAMVYNELWQLKWKMHEALNESAPQLLLQLVIAIVQLGNDETVGPVTITGIVVSLVSFSWTLHLFHYSEHYDGLKNNFKLLHRASDFVAHFLIVGCRFIALSMVMALYPLWFPVAAFSYLGFLSLCLYKYRSDRDDYRRVMTKTTNTLWMVYRVFITPYPMRIWRVSVYDDILYNFETFVLALSWPFLLDGDHPLADYRWIITGIIFILNFIILPLLLKLNERMFEEAPGCIDHDPFPIRSELWKDLKAGKTRMRRSFGRRTSSSTFPYTCRIECPIVGIPPVVGTMQ
ncbi:uncharacterized protein LOC124170078 [Ischnura elegans]|uniref:uncharacterized protein LOC124170078 n=1 Tax=Ischnura elegans TaxID=197161 RepID=UPI001ED8998B|nr:uncharacterized protein LOC124170078 [Ischnura elegans]